jgi:hypothetical protein
MSPSSFQAGFRSRKQTPVAADRKTGSLTRFFLMMGLVSAFAGMGNASLAASSDPGRLFYTPAQRAQLESARTQTVTPLGSQSKRGLPDSTPPPLRYDGMVIRSDGKTTRWVDGKPQRDGSDVSGLKPGQVRADGKVYEPYQVQRPVSPAPAVKEPAP